MYLGTPQTTFTIYRKLAERNYRPFVWTARYPRSIANYEGKIAPQQADIDEGAEEWTVTDPDRFTHEDLLEREAAMGRGNFMLRFMLDTSLSDAEKFHLNVVTSWLLLLTLQAHQMPLYGAQIPQMSQRTPNCWTTWDYFYSPMQLQGDWGPYTETICSVDPSGRGADETTASFISQRNGFLYLHEMRAYREGYSTTRSWTF